MSDFKAQMLAHEQILSKYKKLLLEQPDRQEINQHKMYEETLKPGLNGGRMTEKSSLKVEQNFVEKTIENQLGYKNLSDIESIKAKYLNRTDQLGTKKPMSSSFLEAENFSNPIFNKYQSGIIGLIPNRGTIINAGVNENSIYRMNDIEAIKAKYLKNNINDMKNVRSEMDITKTFQKRSSSESKFIINTASKASFEPDRVLEEFKKKYSEQNIEKILEERIKLLHDTPQAKKVSPSIIREDEQNFSTQQFLETSSLEVIKLLNGQSNIKYNISNQSLKRTEEYRKEIYHDESLQVDNISNSLIHSSEMSSQRLGEKEESLQIERINEIISVSSKIIENYEKNKAELFCNLSTIVENLTEKVIENNKKQVQINETLKKIDNDVIPISERLAKLKNLKTNLNSEINKTKIKAPDIPQKNFAYQTSNDEENLLRFSQSKVELLKIPKSRKIKNDNQETINYSKEVSHQAHPNAHHSQLYEIMNNLVFETTRQVFEAPVPLIDYTFHEVIPEDGSVKSNVDTSKLDENNNKRISESLITPLIKNSKAPIISTRAKALPKKNLCSFDNFINNNLDNN